MYFGRSSLNFSPAAMISASGLNVLTTRIMGSATKHYDRATNAHFRPDKLRGATGKSLIVLNPWLSLNQRVPGSSPGAPIKLFKHLGHLRIRTGFSVGKTT